MQPAAKKGSGAMAPVSGESSGRRHGELARGREPCASSSPCAPRLFFLPRSYRSGAGGYHRKAFAARHIGSISSMRPCPRLHATPTPTPTATPSSMAMHTHFSAKGPSPCMLSPGNLLLTGWIGQAVWQCSFRCPGQPPQSRIFRTTIRLSLV